MLPTIRLGFGSFEFRGEKKLAKFLYSNSQLRGIFGLLTLNFRQKYKKSASYKCSWFWTLFEVNKRKNGLVYGYSVIEICFRMTNRRTKNRHVITTERLKNETNFFKIQIIFLSWTDWLYSYCRRAYHGQTYLSWLQSAVLSVAIACWRLAWAPCCLQCL